MDTDHGGTFSSGQPETAAEIARKKVLAVYSSTIESLKKNSGRTNSSNQSYIDQSTGNQYIAPPTPSFTNSQDEFDVNSDSASSIDGDYGQVGFETLDSDRQPISPAAPYQPAQDTATFKDAPINQTAVNDEWQQYHSAWQAYYQNYYSDYYAKAAQNYLATEKLKSERIATGQTRRKRHVRRLIPLFISLAVVLVVLFLQYNRLIFAPIMAYVSPNTDDVATSIEAIDPTVTQAVSPEPRLIIPKLNVDVPVAFGISTAEVDSAMNRGVAQFAIPGANALPGQVGNLVLSGHSAGDIYSSNPYKFIFSGLERLQVGDLIYINYNSVRYTYQMTKSETVEPSDVSALIYTTDRPMLTLITCTPLGTSRYRLLISAEQISPSYTNNSEDEETEAPTPDPSDTTVDMPANEPSFFENIWNGLFGG